LHSGGCCSSSSVGTRQPGSDGKSIKPSPSSSSPLEHWGTPPESVPASMPAGLLQVLHPPISDTAAIKAVHRALVMARRILLGLASRKPSNVPVPKRSHGGSGV